MPGSKEFDDLLEELGADPLAELSADPPVVAEPIARSDQHTAILPSGRAARPSVRVKAAVLENKTPAPSVPKPRMPSLGTPATAWAAPPASPLADRPLGIGLGSSSGASAGESTAVVSPTKRFPILSKPEVRHEPRTAGGRAKRESRPPLDFSKDHKIGRFELIRELARGGMGQVFLARDTKLGRKVAIKFLLRDDPDFVQRFLVEARATARCMHENIVTIYEVDEHGGLPYMVLEYLEGETLSEVLAGKPSLRQFIEIMVSVARALERAHEHGIVHRDLKPSNVFVTDRGQVKVLDFGVARLMDRAGASVGHEAPSIDMRDLREHQVDQSLSAGFTSDSLVGTLPFMSPEQWGADAVDHLSDIWAFGIMFWRALTGVHPVGTTDPSRLRAALLDLATPLPSIGTRDPALSRELVAIVDRCLAKNKADRHQTATELVTALQAFLVPKAERAPGEVCPYRGLAAFGEDDAKYFFGRSSEIRTALSQLEAWPLLAVIGPSGAGKSSFVHAGLVPAMRAAGGRWQVRVIRPGRVPLLRLAGVLEDTLGTGEASPDLIKQLRDSPGLFGSMLRAYAAKRHENILVVVDQLEELFTLCDSDDIRKLFLAALLAAADDPSSPVRVVLSMRADFLDRLAGHKHFLAELSRGLFFLSAPDHDNLRETLVRPAELAGFAFEDPSILEDMLDAATSRGALPLVSFAATRLWDGRDRERKLFTRAAYDQMGGVGGAFARHADRVAAAVAPQHQALLRAVMTRLVTPELTRAVVDHKELLSLSADQAEVERILDQLVQARLIHLETDQDQGATVEIVHETLITEWPTMQRWLEDSQAMRGFLHELRQAARQWAAHGRPADLVWRGATAQQALGNAARHVLDLAAVEREYLAAVRKQATQRVRIRLAVMLALFGGITLVLLGGAVALVRIKAAEADAQEAAREAVGKRRDAEIARGELQGKLDIIQAEKSAREAAEKQQAVEEEKRRLAEQDLAQSREMSREQLEAANAELHQKVLEAQAARARSQAAVAAQKLATEEARQAKKETELLLAKERAARAKLEKEKKNIYDGDLTRPGGRP